MQTRLFHLHALSALHVGTGQAIGAVDLPLARARASHLPLVPGSALKGVLRDEFTKPAVDTLFGPEKIETGQDGFAGALAFGDAHLLLLPVRSLAGIVAYATCPFILTRYAKDLAWAKTPGAPSSVPDVADGQIKLAASHVLEAETGKVVLEDHDLAINGTGAAEEWAEFIAERVCANDGCFKGMLKQRFALLPDSVFSFLADTATEIRARVSIGESGTVEQGPWYEENLPAETVLWGLLGIGKGRDRAMDEAAVSQAFSAGVGGKKLIQIGGKATVGRGLVRFLS